MIVENGKQLSRAAVKKRIKQLTGWGEKRYQREAQIVRKGLERSGLKVDIQKFLFSEAKAKAHYKSEYKSTAYIKSVRQLGRIKSNVIHSGKRSIVSVKKRIKATKLDYIQKRFGGLIRANTGARAIYDAYKSDVYVLEKKLTDFADKLHVKIDKYDKIVSAQAIPFSSEQYGSGDPYV